MNGNGVSDIVFSYPSYDDDNESWSRNSVWFHAAGKRTTYTDADDDGSHTPISRREFDRLSRTYEKEWLEYSKWVLKHGEDPLGEFYVKRATVMKRNYVAFWQSWIGASKFGLAFAGLRWAGTPGNLLEADPTRLPEGLRDYLGLKKIEGRWVLADFKSEAELNDCLKDASDVGFVSGQNNGTGHKAMSYSRGYFKGKAEWKEPRDPAAIRRELLRLARKHIDRAIHGAKKRDNERVSKEEAVERPARPEEAQ